MVTVDPRAGSKELVGPLRLRGHKVKVRQMPFGDIAFLGSGPGGRPVKVGIEVKKIGDFLSSIYTGRLASHQLPGMIEHYEYILLLIEGRVKCGRDGELLIHHRYAGWVEPAGGSTRYSAFIRMQLTLALQAGIPVLFSEDAEDSADVITAVYKWFKAGWSSHSTLRGIKYFGDKTPTVRLTRPSAVRRFAAQLPEVGYLRSAAVAEEFPSIRAMVNAPVEAWLRVDGIAKARAKRIWEFME